MNDFFQAVFFGLGNASAVVTGNELGEGQSAAAIEHGKLVLRLTVAIGFVISLALFCSRGLILTIYSFDGGGVTAAMLNGALLVYSIFMIPHMLDYVLVCGILRAGGDTRFCLFANCAGVWLVGVPFAFLAALVWQWPLAGVLTMVVSGDLVSCIICFFRFRSRVWARTLV